MFLPPKQQSTISAATLPNYIVKARTNLFLLGCEYLGYVIKLTGTDLVNKIENRESSSVFSNTCQTNPVSRQYYFSPIISRIFPFEIIFVHSK